ncbi:PREDICTED: monocarboxylate transporter 14-like [Rhagoletis zephyria]|uniref:monocarboxylate transporter 14-like n=1 Tax=Rhagoletis zephyria TaxID=28612 RepID=UPI00081180AB|nr:PREDICTED: monocarboxylate transporter 14-like [Rhagoletis zephyria]
MARNVQSSAATQNKSDIKFSALSTSDVPAVNDPLFKHCVIPVDEGNDIQKPKSLTLYDSCDSINLSNTAKRKPKIPDGGYGWVIVMASLIIALIADGLGFSFGLINSELLAYFGESTSKTAWISSLFFSVPLLMGPIWSNMVDKFGCRKMTIFGGLLASFGFALSSLGNSVGVLMLTFGIISGLGVGIGYVTGIVSITFWFDKKRTFATGIAASGTGIGTLLYAPLTQSLIEGYGWRGATLILAATMLHTCVSGALMRDPDWLIEENRLQSRSQSATSSSACLDEIKKLLDTGVTKEAVLDTLVTKNNTEANQRIKDSHERIIKRFGSEIFLPTFLCSQDLVASMYGVKSMSWRSLRHKDAPSRENLISMASAAVKPTVSVIALHDDESSTPFERLQPADLRKSATSLISLKNDVSLVLDGSTRKVSQIPASVLKSENDVADRPPTKRARADSVIGMRRFSKKPSSPRNTLVHNSDFLKKLRVHRNPIHLYAAMLNTQRHRTRATSCPNICRNLVTAPVQKEEEQTWYVRFVDTMKTTFDLSHFADMKFTLFNISILFLFIWFIIPYLYLPEYMKIHGYETSNSAQLISVIGTAQTFGMITLGYLGDRPWMNVNICYAACMVVCGISVLLMPFLVSTYSLLLLSCVIFGFTFASSFSFTPSICVSIVDLEDFTCAYGLVLLVQGVGMIAGPPIAGAIYEVTLSWDQVFYFAGVFIFLSGVAAYSIEFFKKLENSGIKQLRNLN